MKGGGPGLLGKLHRVGSPAQVFSKVRHPALNRLFNAGIGIGKPSRSRTVKGKNVDWTPNEYAIYSAFHGMLRKRFYDRVVMSPRWSARDDAPHIQKLMHKRLMKKVGVSAMKLTTGAITRGEIDARVFAMIENAKKRTAKE